MNSYADNAAALADLRGRKSNFHIPTEILDGSTTVRMGHRFFVGSQGLDAMAEVFGDTLPNGMPLDMAGISLCSEGAADLRTYAEQAIEALTLTTGNFADKDCFDYRWLADGVAALHRFREVFCADDLPERITLIVTDRYRSRRSIQKTLHHEDIHHYQYLTADGGERYFAESDLVRLPAFRRLYDDELWKMKKYEMRPLSEMADEVLAFGLTGNWRVLSPEGNKWLVREAIAELLIKLDEMGADVESMLACALVRTDYYRHRLNEAREARKVQASAAQAAPLAPRTNDTEKDARQWERNGLVQSSSLTWQQLPCNIHTRSRRTEATHEASHYAPRTRDQNHARQGPTAHFAIAARRAHRPQPRSSQAIPRRGHRVGLRPRAPRVRGGPPVRPPGLLSPTANVNGLAGARNTQTPAHDPKPQTQID